MAEFTIGITAGIEQASWRDWTGLAFLSPRNYALAVQREGGLAILLPPEGEAEGSSDRLLELLDGLIITGGSDLDPATYGRRSHPRTSPASPERDRFELALARIALDRDLPLLAICRGMEVLNVARGGTLVQHLPEAIGSELHLHTPGAFADHEVRLEPDSVARSAAGAERIAVKSHHHQALDELGEGIVASGWSVPDDVVEAVEVPARRFALGVLWHPEEHAEDRVIGSFVSAVRSGTEAVAR
jgi:putative glutamine amidotransferase